MLDLLPGESWKDPNQTFLDPSCGDGNFLVAVKERLLGLGFSEEDALARIYGIDLMHDNVVEACKRLGLAHHKDAPFAVSKTVICANTIENDIPQLFEDAEREFLYQSLKGILLSLKDAVKDSGDAEAKTAWKAGRDLAKELRSLGNGRN